MTLSYRLPRAVSDQSLDGLAISGAERVFLAKMLLANGEDNVATWAQRSQHVIEAARWQEVRAKASSAGHNIEIAAEGLWKRLLAHNESLDLLVDALSFEDLLLGVATFLAIDLVDTVFDEKGTKVAAASSEVEDLSLATELVLVADLNDALDAHERLGN